MKIVLDRIAETRQGIEHFARQGRHTCAEEKCIFVTFWDFDGTILHGDCTDGLRENGQVVYPGLQQLAIEAGLSPRYSGSNAFARYQADYDALEEREGYGPAFAYIPTIYAGTPRRLLDERAREVFESSIRNYYFASSVDILRNLHDDGVRTYIISASPTFFVRAAAESIGVPREWISGYSVEVDNGLLTDRVIEPLNYAEGKTERIQLILDEIRATEQTENVYVLGGFGNSYHTDSHFLKWVASQQLPSGAPVAVLINGDAPAGEESHFLNVSQTELVSQDGRQTN